FARLAQFADLFDAVVAGSINLENIQRAALGDLLAARILFIEINPWPVSAVQAFGKDTRDGGFAGAARAAEQISMGDALLLDSMRQSLGDVFLAHYVLEALWAILSGYDLVRHSRFRIYGLWQQRT